ncbi:membrane magnesium transporter-like isoform X1 [Vigna unguiculata]|uniref:membrane magnesium transporter-like isoform X1 n=1 Tax=Vigna unguiculata TaxID=3917 RepID=UPI0010171575|nr:membrane magnesium transporter-like isoform X1 [Vigna unguiculata]
MIENPVKVFCVLVHAAYSTIHYRGLLKITEEEFSGPPYNFGVMQVVIELFVGLLLCFWAALTVPWKFKSIHPHSEENRFVAYSIGVDFGAIGSTYIAFFVNIYASSPFLGRNLSPGKPNDG